MMIATKFLMNLSLYLHWKEYDFLFVFMNKKCFSEINMVQYNKKSVYAMKSSSSIRVALLKKEIKSCFFCILCMSLKYF